MEIVKNESMIQLLTYVENSRFMLYVYGTIEEEEITNMLGYKLSKN